MEFSREGYWSGLSFPPPRDLPDTDIKPTSPKSPALVGRFFSTEPPEKSTSYITFKQPLLVFACNNYYCGFLPNGDICSSIVPLKHALLEFHFKEELSCLSCLGIYPIIYEYGLRGICLFYKL